MKKDKGFSWIILFAACLTIFIVGSVFAIPSWFIMEYSHVFDVSYALSGIPGALNSSFVLVFAIPSGVFIKKYDCKLSGFIGGICIFCGLFICAFAPNLYVIMAAYGIICSFGQALAYSSALNVTHTFFDKYEAVASNIVMSGFPLSIIVFVPCLNLMIEEFGYRGASLVHSGLVLHLLVFSLCFRPSNSITTSAVDDDVNKTSIDKHMQSNKTEDINDSEDLEQINQDKKEDKTNQIDLNLSSSEEESCLRKLKQTYVSLLQNLNINLFKNLPFSLFCIASLFISYMEEITTLTVIKLHDDIKMSKTEASALKATSSIAVLICSVINTLIINIKWINPVILNALSTFLTSSCIIALNFVHNKLTALIACIGIGIGFSGVYGFKYYILSRIVTKEERPMAIGWSQALSLISSLTGLPFAGLMYDLTGSHDLAYYLAGLSGILAGILVIAIYILIRK